MLDTPELLVEVYQKSKLSRGQWQTVNSFDSIRISKKSGKVLRIKVTNLPVDITGELIIRFYELSPINCFEQQVEILSQDIHNSEAHFQIKIFAVAKCCQFYANFCTNNVEFSGQSVQFSTYDSGKAPTSPDQTEVARASSPKQATRSPSPESISTPQSTSTLQPDPLVINQSMVVNGSIHAFEFVQYSDERLKSDIQRISNALELVSQLRGSKYVWKHNERKAYGLIAQGLRQLCTSQEVLIRSS